MKGRDLFLLLVLLFFANVMAQTQSEAWQKLTELRDQKTVNLLTPDLARQVFFVAPRNYSLVLFLTAHRRRCAHCKVVSKPFELAGVATPGTPVFFFKVDFFENRELAQKLNIANLPAVVHIPPSDYGVELEPEDFWHLSMETLTPDHLLDWLSSRVHYNISRPTPPLYIVLGIGLALLATLLSYYAIRLAISNPRHWIFFFVISLCLFFASQAGLVWNTNNHPPFQGFNLEEGVIDLVSSSPSGQYVIEGYLLAILQILIGLCFICLIVIPLKFGKWLTRIIFYPTLLGVGFLIYVLSDVYCLKNDGYEFCVDWFDLRYALPV